MGVSLPQIVIVLVVALLVIGPKKLPDIAKSLGKGYAEFRRAFGDLKKSVDLTGDLSGKSSSRAATTSPAPRDTYKSRWEEQVGATEAKEISVESPQSAPSEPPPPERSRRADLIKED